MEQALREAIVEMFHCTKVDHHFVSFHVTMFNIFIKIYSDIFKPPMQSDAYSWVHTVTEREVISLYSTN